MAMVFSLLLAVVGFVAFNGLGAGLSAMAIATVTALRSLFEHKKTTKISYEIVPHVSHVWSGAGLENNRISDLDSAYHTLV